MGRLFKDKDLLGLSWPYVAIITANLIWGINFLAAKFALQEFPVMSLSFLRFFFALILILPFLLTDKKNLKIKKEDLPWFILVGSLLITFNITSFYEGLQKTTVTDASLLTLVIPVISVLLGWIFLKEKVYTVNILGIILGLVGSILVIGLPLSIVGTIIPQSKILGNILILISALCWVVGAVLVKKLLNKYSSLTTTFVLFLIGTLSFLIPAIQDYLKDPSWPAKVTYVGFLGLSFIVFASSIVAFFTYDWGLKRLGIIKADLFQYLQPLIAIFLAVLFLGEKLQYSLIIGGVLIGLGTYWGVLGKEKTRHPHHHKH